MMKAAHVTWQRPSITEAAEPEGFDPTVIQDTVGFIVDEKDGYICLSPMYNEQSQTYEHVINIPISTITFIHRMDLN